jgi:hypothetical protein
MQIIGAIYSSRDFKYSKDSRQFTSSIRITPAVLRQLWNESFEIGFAIRSERTGKVACFVLKEARKDSEGKYTEWFFESPEIPQVTALVVNS